MVVRRSDADLWMHVESRLDIAKYEDPASAVERRQSMLADHGLYGDELEDASSGLRRWMPVMPSIARPRTQLTGGETFTASGRRWQVVPTPGHSPGHVCLWSAGDRLLCSGDHLLKGILPPVTFERGFEADPMGSYLDSLETVRALAPELVLPGHGEVFAGGAARAEAIGRNKLRRVGQVQELLEGGDRTVADVTGVLFRQQLTSSQLHFAMAEVLAYLAYLEARGLAHRLPRPGGGFLWRAGARSA